MSSMFNGNIKISIFGESHGAAIGAVLDGLPAGENIDLAEVIFQMQRRAPGQNSFSSARREEDTPQIISGLFEGHTTGAPLCALIENTNAKPSDYNELKSLLRPGHADYPAHVKYKGFNDVRGGGHFSGRLTAALTFCGAVCRQILARRGVTIGAHIYSIHEVCDVPFETNISEELLSRLSRENFALIDASRKEKMLDEIHRAKTAGDSVGGIIECAINNVPAGVGGPIFDGIENKISSLVFAIPSVKGVEFGAGFRAAAMLGSQNNDEFAVKAGKVFTRTNNHGGILGGVTSGMPIVFRCAIKPTPSISRPQATVNINTLQPAEIIVSGRHDPCIVPRAVPVVEAVAAVAMMDFLREAELL